MPSLSRQAWNLATSLAAFVADGCCTVGREEYQRRLDICDGCENRSGNRCSVCGCNLSLKAKGRAFTCPAGKWDSTSSPNNISSDTTLSIVVIDNCELPPSFLRSYFDSLSHFNRDGLEHVQIVLVSQRPDPAESFALAAKQPFPVETFRAEHPLADGYPIWDVTDSLKQVWPRLKGEYISVEHPEFFLAPGRLAKTVEYLRFHQPWIALGNLRRFGDQVTDWRANRHDPDLAQPMLDAIRRADWSEVGRLCESVPTKWWSWWNPDPAGANRTKWEEDQFFIRRDWLEAIRFLDHCDRQAFQDVYDLLARLWRELNTCQLAPPCIRLPIDVHKSLHLPHDRAWSSWTPAVRDWFLSDSKTWGDTQYGQPAAWEPILCLVAEAIHLRETVDPENPRWIQYSTDVDKAVYELRNGRGGTVTRFMERLKAWMSGGRREELQSFYQKVKP